MNAPSSRSARVKKFFDLGTVVLFAGALIAPLIDMQVRDVKARGPGPELREPAPMPEPPKTLAELIEFPKRYEQHWNDTFGLRDKLLRKHSALKVLGLGVSPDASHVIGKDNWIYNDNSKIVDSWRGVIPFTERRLEAWRKRLERRRDAVAALGAHYLFALAPDKPSIYPEYLPERFNKVGPSRQDQFFEYMRAHTDVDVLDLRPALLAEKVNDQPGDYVYYALGTHWKLRGAIAGFNAFVERLRPRFPGMISFPVSAHTLVDSDSVGDSEARNMYIIDLIPQREHWYVLGEPRRRREVLRLENPTRWFTEIDDPRLPRVMLYHDSFGPYFENEWSETCSYLAMYWTPHWDLRDIAAENPDVVIEFVVERCLFDQDPNLILPGEAAFTRQERFDRAEKGIYTLDPAQTNNALRVAEPTSMTSKSDDRGAFVELRTTSKRGVVELLGHASATQARILARCELDVESAGLVSLHWSCAGDGPQAGPRKASARVQPGANCVFFEFQLGKQALETLQLDPFPAVGQCKLRAVELRTETARQ